jgi:hypothetical protein
MNVRGVRVGCRDFIRGVRNSRMGCVILVRVYILYCVHLINIVLFKASSYEFNDSVFL